MTLGARRTRSPPLCLGFSFFFVCVCVCALARVCLFLSNILGLGFQVYDFRWSKLDQLQESVMSVKSDSDSRSWSPCSLPLLSLTGFGGAVVVLQYHGVAQPNPNRWVPASVVGVRSWVGAEVAAA